MQKNSFDYNKTINYLLIAYAFSLPISKACVNIFEILILLTWIIQGNWKDKYSIYKNSLFLKMMSVFILINILSIPFASNFSFALDYIAKYRHFLIIFPIYTSLTPKAFKYVLSSFLLGMFLSELVSYAVFFELIQYKNILPSDPTPFMDHVSYSVFLAFTSILLLTRSLHIQGKNIKLRLLYILFFISSTANLFINGGRTGQVTIAILIFICTLMTFKNKLYSLFIATSLILSIFLISYNYSPNFQKRFDQASNGVTNMIYRNNYTSDGFSQRVSLWIIGIDEFKENLLGKGLGNTTQDMGFYAKLRGFDDQFIRQFGDHHNMFLITALQFGILGLISFTFIFYALINLQFKLHANKILNLTFVIGFLLWSMGNTTFHTMNPMTFFALFAGLFNAISYIETKKNTIKGYVHGERSF